MDSTRGIEEHSAVECELQNQDSNMAAGPEDDSSTDKGLSEDDASKTVDNKDPEVTEHWRGADDLAQNLFLPLRFHVMAYKFEALAFKLLTRGQFHRAAELAWREAECFLAVMDELYSSSLGTGVTVRDRLPPRWVWHS